MKVLFAVSNEEISEAIVKKYRKEYKEIISYKNVYYFNAILKELQKEKSYDRIVISEELEAFANAQYNQIDKFIFDKLDSISDEASNLKGDDIPIILICSDRREKSEEMLVKFFGIGIYNALIGKDRSVDKVCELIRKPRLKKEAKVYYKIDSDDVSYQAESENDVSEVEIQNILAHYKRLGKDEKRYVESFDNIASQYNDVQLRVISKFLPLGVRAVLEAKSPKYQQVISHNRKVSSTLRGSETNVEKKESGTSEKLLKNAKNKNNLTEPVIIPSAVDMSGTKKMGKYSGKVKPLSAMKKQADEEENNDQDILDLMVSDDDIEEITSEVVPEKTTETVVEAPKKRRGRPRKNPVPEETAVEKPKRGRGRPRKTPVVEEVELDEVENEDDEEENILPGMGQKDRISELLSSSGSDNEISYSEIEDEEDDDDEFNLDTIFASLEDEEDDDIEEVDENKSNIHYHKEEKEDDKEDSNEEFISLDDFESLDYDDNDDEEEQNDNKIEDDEEDFGFLPQDDEIENDHKKQDDEKEDFVLPGFDEDIEEKHNVTRAQENYKEKSLRNTNETYNDVDISNLLTSDKKIACFVGTSKNGTSFIVNNLAQFTADRGIDTAILDLTKNKNSYYIYTNNEEGLRNVAASTFENLLSGNAKGIMARKNVTVYTSLPEDAENIENAGQVLQSLLKKHALVLIDCDFNTPIEYFAKAQEIYLVQSMDILTIQPLTAFLRELKSKNVLEENKLRAILNKTLRVKGVNDKILLGGMAYYNDPAMSFMTELFDKNIIKYLVMPFNEEVYAKYLGSIVDCEMSVKGYPKNIVQIFSQLSNMVYPLISTKNSYAPPKYEKNGFSDSVNSTLNQMKNKY